MRASGRPPHSHRDPSRPSRGGDRLDRSIGGIAHRLMSLRSNLARRIAGAPPAPPRALPHALPHPALPHPGADGFDAGTVPSWLVPPGTMLGRAPAGQEPWPSKPWVSATEEGLFEMPAPVHPGQHGAAQGLVHDGQPDMPFESRIDPRASGPGVLVRTPRRPAAIAPETGTVAHALPVSQPAPGGSYGVPQAPLPEAVRFTRTPDTVLMERRRQALEAEREAQARAQALLDAQAAAEAAALEAQRAREAAEHEAAERAAQLAAEEAEAARLRAEQAVSEVPSWRRPFVPPPGVSFFRTPDRRPKPVVPMQGSGQGAGQGTGPGAGQGGTQGAGAVPQPMPEPVIEAPRIEAAAPVAAEAESATAFASLYAPFIPPVPAEPSDWSDVPDWSALHGWFGPAEAMVEVAEPVAPPALRPVLNAMAARAAIRSARSALAEAAPILPVLPHAVAPAPAAAAAPVAVQPAPTPIAMAPQIPSPAPQAAPLTIAARPVLLRTKPGSETEEPAAEVVPSFVTEAFEESAQEAAPEAAPESAPEIAPETAYAFEEGAAESVAAVEPAPENRPRAILPERPMLIPAGRHLEASFVGNADYELPSLELLAEPPVGDGEEVDADELEQNALNLQQTVQDFGVRGDILAVRPGPVVTLYELEPAPGTKSSRVIGLSDDIARSMSAVSARVAVVPGRNVIGIELPNPVRETVYLRELLASVDFVETKHKLALCLGKNIGGEPIIADLARMPHLLVAGTTGSGKSVAINTMILSLLYRLKPEECRLIMVDPKMLELSVYDGIPHLLSPVVIDPKKAVIALKWAVREMEERYKKMSKISVRNIDGYNARMKEARERGEIITRTVQTGFDRTTGEAVFEEQEMDLSALPYIVIVVDEMADLMMVAGKDIEGAIQRLAQMARAAGIHLIMATQRPSVDVITGTIKANFPTRISFQVTSKIDSRTILGEMGAEQLLGQGDMLFMAGGGRTTRVHGPFCSDSEVETVVAHLKAQGRPSYLEAVTADDGSSDQPEKPAKGSRAAAKAEKDDFAEAEEADAPVFDIGAFAATAGAEGGELYEQAIAVVLRDRKASTSYIQRRLQIGYNRAASIMERMEIEGIVGPANHAGKREILVEGLAGAPSGGYDDE
jgi:S-DNA-T family DNA segregation ATPase FtsK/SpoIIIE